MKQKLALGTGLVFESGTIKSAVSATPKPRGKRSMLKTAIDTANDDPLEDSLDLNSFLS